MTIKQVSFFILMYGILYINLTMSSMNQSKTSSPTKSIDTRLQIICNDDHSRLYNRKFRTYAKKELNKTNDSAEVQKALQDYETNCC